MQLLRPKALNILNRMARSTVAVTALCAAASTADAQARGTATVRVSELAPRFHLLSTPDAHLVVYVDDSASAIFGVQSRPLVARARELLRALKAPPVRYMVALEHDSAPGYADGGWGRTGATTLAHEMLYVRMRRQERDTAQRAGGAPPRTALPGVGFSRVVQLWMKSDHAHVVHDRAAATDADVIVHFEQAGLLITGGLFTSDGYPAIDASRGGSLAGMIRWVTWFTENLDAEKVEPIVPGRGPVATMADLRAYRDMLTTVRDRVAALRTAGRSVQEVIAARPTQDLDVRWGRGPVPPAAFVRMVYESLSGP